MKADRERLEPFVGKELIIDEGYTNEGIVILVRIYGDQFCEVKDPNTGAQWDTMLNRLTIKPTN